jgi:hypothetical protein
MRLRPADGGLPLSISADRAAGRVRVSCGPVLDHEGKAIWWQDVAPWGIEAGGRPKAPEITVSLARGWGAIAREINRRMLPDMDKARPWFADRVASVKGAADQYAQACEMLRGMGATMHDSGRGRETCRAYFKTASGGTFSVTVRDYGTVEVREDLPPGDTLRDVIRAILASR